MSRRTYFASFDSDLLDGAPNAHPEGEPLASWLAEALRDEGRFSAQIDDWRDGGYSIDCHIDQLPVYVVLTRHRAAQRWLLMCTSDRGWLRSRLSGDDAAQRLKLARLVHVILAGAGHVRDLRWYPPGWSGDLGGRWTPEP